MYRLPPPAIIQLVFIFIIHLLISVYPPTDYIIRGRSTDIENYPFQVSIRGRRTNKHLCAGAIITEKFIVTAAHCINRAAFEIDGKYQQYIFVGSTELSGEGQTYDIEYGIYHPHFGTKHRRYDIGLIAIQDKFIFNKCVQPAKILSNNIPVGTTVTVTGWGRTSYPKIGRPDILQVLKVPVISLKKCKAAFKKQRKIIIDHSQFCIFKTGHYGTCLGDSGGPVTFQGVLVGVVSWGKPCAKGKPDVNTKLSTYIKWIKTKITRYCETRNCPKENLFPKFVKIHKIYF